MAGDRAWSRVDIARRPSADMIAACTERRLAGDWRGACVAADFGVDTDPANVRDRYGHAVAEQLESGLHALAPELVRGYLPDSLWQDPPFGPAAALADAFTPMTDRHQPPRLVISIRRAWPGWRLRPVLAIHPAYHTPLPKLRLPGWCWRADAVSPRRVAYAGHDPSAVELAALANGTMSADQLHPLVHDVLYPDRRQQPVAPHWDWPPVRVRCGGDWHELAFERGRLEARAHSDSPDPSTGCGRVQRTWRRGAGRLPRRLWQQRAVFFTYARYGHTDEVVAMLDAGFDPTATDPYGATLLHHLAALDHRRLWPRLRLAGLPVNGRDRDGCTPLHYAASRHNRAVFDLLVAAGADRKATTQRGVTPRFDPR